LEADVFKYSAELMMKLPKSTSWGFSRRRSQHNHHEVPGSPYSGIAFLTPERAVKVLSKMVSYNHGWSGKAF
jgi:hypothetical protein